MVEVVVLKSRASPTVDKVANRGPTVSELIDTVYANSLPLAYLC